MLLIPLLSCHVSFKFSQDELRQIPDLHTEIARAQTIEVKNPFLSFPSSFLNLFFPFSNRVAALVCLSASPSCFDFRGYVSFYFYFYLFYVHATETGQVVE